MIEQSAGTILRQTREEKKLSLDQVFQATRIRISYLQAIENDQLDQLPSRAQARGFIHLYANYLDLDPYDLLVSPQIPEATPEEAAPSPAQPGRVQISAPEIKDTFKKFVGQGKESVDEMLKGSSQKIQDSFEQLTNKIPYRIVKKNDQAQPLDETVSEPTLAPLPVNSTAKLNNYQAMCKAIGSSLRKKRESLGLSLADVERQIRIREIYLFALEEGNLDDLPSTVQGRGMLSNYAAFMGLNSEEFLSRFAEALQQKRIETIPEEKAGIPLPASSSKQTLTGIRKLLSPDLIFTGGMFLVFFVFIIWGAVQLVGISSNSVSPTVIPISDLLLSSGTPVSSDLVTIQGVTVQASQSGIVGFTPFASQEGTTSPTISGSIQLVVVAQHRAYMKITVDGKDVFNGRVVPGTPYTYSGNTAIVLLTGDASALEVYYNQKDLGILGSLSQVMNIQYTAKGYTDLGALNTATPAPTSLPTLTPQPTAKPTLTPTLMNSTPTP